MCVDLISYHETDLEDLAAGASLLSVLSGVCFTEPSLNEVKENDYQINGVSRLSNRKSPPAPPGGSQVRAGI